MTRVAQWRLPAQQAGRWSWVRDIPPTTAIKASIVVFLGFFYFWYTIVYCQRPLTSLMSLGTLPPLGFVFLKGAALMSPKPTLRRRLRAASRRSDYPVRVTLWRSGVSYGQDDGLVSFEDGALVFRGDATEFRLLPAAVSLPPNAFANGALIDDDRWGYGNHADGGNAWCFHLADHPDVRVYFYSMTIRGFASLNPPLYAWLTQPPAARGETTLPPLDPLPGYVQPTFFGRRKSL